jgi:hypothetical protein
MLPGILLTLLVVLGLVNGPQAILKDHIEASTLLPKHLFHFALITTSRHIDHLPPKCPDGAEYSAPGAETLRMSFRRRCTW